MLPTGLISIVHGKAEASDHDVNYRAEVGGADGSYVVTHLAADETDSVGGVSERSSDLERGFPF